MECRPIYTFFMYTLYARIFSRAEVFSSLWGIVPHLLFKKWSDHFKSQRYDAISGTCFVSGNTWPSACAGNGHYPWPKAFVLGLWSVLDLIRSPPRVSVFSFYHEVPALLVLKMREEGSMQPPDCWRDEECLVRARPKNLDHEKMRRFLFVLRHQCYKPCSSRVVSNDGSVDSDE